MFDYRTKQGRMKPKKKLGNFISASNYKKRCEKLKREQPMTDEQILDIATSGHMIKKAAATEKKRLPHNMYEMYMNIGNTLINSSRYIRELQNKLDEATDILKEYKVKMEKIRKDLKAQDIKDIKSEGRISHENRL